MGTIVELAKHKDIQKADEKFVGLLDDYCQKEGTISPLSKSLFDRIEKIRHTVSQTKQHLLEG